LPRGTTAVLGCAGRQEVVSLCYEFPRGSNEAVGERADASEFTRWRRNLSLLISISRKTLILLVSILKISIPDEIKVVL